MRGGMDEPVPAPPPGRFLHVFLPVWGLVTLASLVIFVIRADFVVRRSTLFNTTGQEAPGIYAIWKAQHGYPVYEWPDRGDYALTLYNFGFYRLYAAVLSLLGQTDERILVGGRLLTAAFAVAGIGAHWGVVRRVLPRPAPRGVTWAAALTVVGLWLGRSSFSWWYLTVRPDLPGIVLAVFGLWMVMRALDRDPDGRGPGALADLLAAAAFFFAAWTFKQSMVLTLGGCLLYLLLARRWRLLPALALPFALGCALTLVLGGEQYRRNVLFMPSVAPPNLKWGLQYGISALAPNAILVVLPLLVPWAVRPARGDEEPEFESEPGRRPPTPLRGRLRLLVTVAAVTLAGNGMAIFKLGSAQNYMFEPMVHLATLCVFVLAWLARPGAEPVRVLGRFAAVGLALWGAVLPVLTLLFPQGLARLPLNLVYGRAQVARRQALVDALRDAPRPMLIVDEVLSQPWHATNNRHPALVIDTMSFSLAQDRGVVPKTLMQDLLIQGKYASGVFPRDSDVARAALASGLVAHALPPEATGGADLVLLTRPGATTTRP